MSLLVILLACGAAGADAARLPADAAAIQTGMQQFIDFLDSPAYAKAVLGGEHVVLSYQLAQHRDPAPEEFLVLSELYGGPGFKRSEVLAMALCGKAPELTWDQCREFLGTKQQKDFKENTQTRATADRLAQTCGNQVAAMLSPTVPYAPPAAPVEKAAALPVPNEEYNVYYGYLHAHSGLSLDARGAPSKAYAYARDVGHLDYFSLTDHAEFLAIWPWDHKWEQLKDAAAAAYEPGKFVTLWGFEWSNPVLGHMNVLNSEDITNSVVMFRLPDFYSWLSGRPGAFGTFNHPGLYNALGIELRHLQRFDEVVGQMVGIEVANDNDSFNRYYYSGSWDSDYSYWDEGNQKGWRLGPVIGQDNHYEDWGTMNDFRAAVLAKELTREAIIDAYENRRFYATENSSIRLDFRCNGYPMGSMLDAQPRVFTVKASTAADEAFEQIRLFRDGTVLQTQAVSGNPVEVTFSDPAYSADAYYYVIATENMDTHNKGRNDEAISAPIWLAGPPPVTAPSCGTLALGISGGAGKNGHGDWVLLLISLAFLAGGRTMVMHKSMMSSGASARK
jgi:hypothetical protein